MSEAIQQIAERLRGLRDVLEISVEEMAEVCRLTPEEYLRLESGTEDISIDMLHTIARKYGVEPITLMFGDEPKMSTYFVTRSGRGASVERTKAYKYQSLAAGFLSRRADPFMVTVHPKPEGTPIFLNRHTGQEYNYVVSGRMLLHDDDRISTKYLEDRHYFCPLICKCHQECRYDRFLYQSEHFCNRCYVLRSRHTADQRESRHAFVHQQG